jgi:hypothetical protein
MFIIIEPDMVEYYLGDTTSVPIVKSPTDFIPVNNRFLDVIPHNKPIMPDKDHTSYFCLHEQMIRCSRASLEYASCSGLFCDRQRLNLGPSEKCGCMYVSPENGDLVIDLDVTFDVDRSFHLEGKITVSHFRSWRFSKLFVKDSSIWKKLDRDEDWVALRKAVADVTTYVNDNGGWTIVWWVHCGQVKDQSSGIYEPETLASMHPKPHISYLFPSQNAVAIAESIKPFQLIKTK